MTLFCGAGLHSWLAGCTENKKGIVAEAGAEGKEYIGGPPLLSNNTKRRRWREGNMYGIGQNCIFETTVHTIFVPNESL